MQKDNKEHDASQQRGFCTCAATAILDVSILPCDETWLVVFISEIKRAMLDSAATTWAAGMYTFFRKIPRPLDPHCVDTILFDSYMI